MATVAKRPERMEAMMSMKNQQQYWRKEADKAETQGAALVAFGVYAGLVLAEEDARRNRAMKPLSPSAIACLHQLFKDGPTWDGNIVSKPGRGELIAAGLSDRVDGWAFLTADGVKLAASVYGQEKI